MLNKLSKSITNLEYMISTGFQKTYDVTSREKKLQTLYKLLQTSQFKAGKNADGSDISPSYTIGYREYKRKRGLVYNRVTLLLTGSFYKGVMFDVNSKGTLIGTSTDVKTKRLEAKYTKAIWGLDKSKNEQTFLIEFKKIYLAKIRKEIKIN